MKAQNNDIDIESIPEDIEDKRSISDSSQSSISKSSTDEQSEILVLAKKAINNTRRQQDDKTLEEELQSSPPSSLPLLPCLLPSKIESDDKSHDTGEVDEGNKHIEQENRIDRLTEILVRTFIDEAIDKGKEIENSKSQSLLTKEASEWIPAEDLADDENNKQISTNQNDDIE